MLTEKMKKWISENIDDYMELGEVQLTLLEEAIMDEFDIYDEEWEDEDSSFELFTYLKEIGFLQWGDI